MKTGQSSWRGSLRCSSPMTSRYHAIDAGRSPTFSETWSSLLEAKGRQAARDFSSKGTSGQAPLLQFEMTVAVTPATGSWSERNDTPAS